MEKIIEERAIIEAFNYANGKSLFQTERQKTSGVMNNAAFLRYNLKDDEKTNSLSIIKAFANGYLEGAEIEHKPSEPTDTATDRKPVSIVTENGGKVVRVETLDECFGITLYDAEGGKEIEWKEAFERYQLPTKKQAAIICAYLDDINAKLKEAGGEPLDKWYWTSSEYYANSAWFYLGDLGILNYSSKVYTNSVRPVLAF